MRGAGRGNIINMVIKRLWLIFLTLLTLNFGRNASADGLCVKDLEFDRESILGDRLFSSFGGMIPVESMGVAYLDLGSGIPVLKLDGDRISVALEPPLDQWNKLLPDFFFQSDDDIWAYTRVNPTLYRYDPSEQRFRRHSVSEISQLKGFGRSDWRRRHEDRTDKTRSRIGTGEVFVRVANELFALSDGAMEKVSMPPSWNASNSVPINIIGLGSLSHVGGEIWFQAEARSDWKLVAEIKDLSSRYSQSPFSIFQVKFQPETGEVRLLLEDRVLVGEVADNGEEIEFDYQFSGDVVIHQPTGQVLVWAGEPLTEKRRERPHRFQAVNGLWEMTAKQPTRVEGFAAEARLSEGGNVPLQSNVHHRALGLTIVSHEGGFAIFDGETLEDVPALAKEEGQTFFLSLAGGRTFAKSHDRLVEIKDDLSVVEIIPPKIPENLFDLYFSNILGGFIMFSRGWEHAYFTGDFQDYTEISGVSEPIIGVLGDLAFMPALIVYSASQVYAISECQ